MKRYLIFLILTIIVNIFPQSSYKIMSYNLLNYPGNDTTTRNPYFRTIIKNVRPDVLVVQEMTSQSGVDGFLNNVLNSVSSGYAAGTFIDGPDTDCEIYFKSSLFKFISNKPIQTALRNIYEFTIVDLTNKDTLRIYSVHLKASSGTTNEEKRAAEVDSLRKVTDKLPKDASFIVVGDYNIYSANESAFQELLDHTKTGYFIDPLNMTGTWHDNPIYAAYFTQSPRTRQFGGGANGGLDDRFDMILISSGINNGVNISLVPNTYTAYGNDGQHMNDSVNSVPNLAVSQEVADALCYASDHLPVFTTFEFMNALPVEMLTFNAAVNGNSIDLFWQTATELNVYGFDIERKIGNSDWEKIGFIIGAGNSNSPLEYHFQDNINLAGNYQYRIKQLDNNGTFKYYLSNTVNVKSPNGFMLQQNYPNPFNPTTTIKYEIPKANFVTIKVFNILGKEVASLVNENKKAGDYNVEFNANKLSSGVYFYRIKAGSFVETKKLILMK